MSKPITASEMGKRGGKARGLRLSKQRLSEIGRLGGLASKAAADKRKQEEAHNANNT
jgi:general stress protein YciG